MFNLRNNLLITLVGLVLLSPELGATTATKFSSLPKQQAATFAVKRVEDEPRNWKEVVSPEGRYTIRMPAEPKYKTLPSDEGKSPAFLASLETEAAIYSVWYRDYPRDIGKPEQVKLALKFSRDYALSESKGALIKESEIVSGDILGLESIIDLKEGLIWRVRMYLDGRRFYQVAFWVTKEKAESHADYYDRLAAKYFASFKIVP